MKTFKQFMTENREVNENAAKLGQLLTKGLGNAAKIIGGAGLGAWLTDKYHKIKNSTPKIQEPVLRFGPGDNINSIPGKDRNTKNDV